ncbi:MAG: biopolymer transporter ExbD [Bacteroidota bacterium]|nr:biopolymer transporter ExbD [Bacteroidota bacterium]MDX5431784.1 biopolymer transporter ExbD [Bacteroidota bacterium]MDX5470497.1 biopolymer transporter ExbD [Bacteroidota bacterium]
MTDLIFLLLIFFIITSTMVNPNAIKLLLPKGNVQTSAPKPIEISIDADTRVYVMNKEVSYEGLPSAMQEALTGKNPDEVTLALSADKSVPLEFVVKVMTVAQQMKLRMVIRTGRE